MLYQSLLYIDPGSGSYLAQIIAAIVLGGVMFFKNIKLYIKAIFRRAFKSPKDNSSV